MRIVDCAIPGVKLIELTPIADERGSFTRTFCAETFAAAGMSDICAQASVAFNPQRGTLRGMHYQRDDQPEAKLVRCSRGAIFDVALDMRPGSPTEGEWLSCWLTEDNHQAIYLPTGVAHGYLTLSEGAEVSYQMSTPYVPGATQGVRWDDPAFGIAWPEEPQVISARDASYPSVVRRWPRRDLAPVLPLVL